MLMIVVASAAKRDRRESAMPHLRVSRGKTPYTPGRPLRCLTGRRGRRICSTRPPLSTDAPSGAVPFGRPPGGSVRQGAAVTRAETYAEGRREVLRQASRALGGLPVTVWEVSARAEPEPQATSDAVPAHHATNLDVDATLRRWHIPIVQGSRWIGSRAAPEGAWVIAPGRLTLELAGLCLGLLDRREPTEGAPASTRRADPLQDMTTLPGIIAHELSNPLTAARAGLQLVMEAVGRWTEVAAGRRLELLDELGQVIEDIDRSASFLRAVKDPARGTPAFARRTLRAFSSVVSGPKSSAKGAVWGSWRCGASCGTCSPGASR